MVGVVMNPNSAAKKCSSTPNLLNSLHLQIST